MLYLNCLEDKTVSKSTSAIEIIIIIQAVQAIQAFANICQHILNICIVLRVFPSGGVMGDPLFHDFHHSLVPPPQKFPENNRENNSHRF